MHMSEPISGLSSFGLSSTGLLEVDRRIVEIISDDQTSLTPAMHSKQVLGKDLYFGQTTYESGKLPFIQTVAVDTSGEVEQLILTQEGARELPEGFKEKAAALEERTFLEKPSESFPNVVGWQMMLTWGYFHLESYRAQRAEALYQQTAQTSLAHIRASFRDDPILTISPIIIPASLDDLPYATEMYGMFGRYNRGDIIPASVDLDKYPYMEERSFEDKHFMQSLVDDLLSE